MAKTSVPSFVQEFSHGLYTKVAPNLAPIGSAVECENVNLESGALAPFKGPKELGKATDKTLVNFKHNNSFHKLGASKCNMLDTCFVTSHHAIQKSYDGIKWFNIGIEGPKAAISVTAGPPNSKPLQQLSLSSWSTEYNGDANCLDWENTTGSDIYAIAHIPPFIPSEFTETPEAMARRFVNRDLRTPMGEALYGAFIGHVLKDAHSNWNLPYLKEVEAHGPAMEHCRGKYGTTDRRAAGSGLRCGYIASHDLIRTLYDAWIEVPMPTESDAVVVPAGARFRLRLVANVGVASDPSATVGNNPQFTKYPTQISSSSYKAQLKNPLKVDIYPVGGSKIVGLLEGNDFIWCYTYYNANDGAESAPSLYTKQTAIGEPQDTGKYLKSYAILDNIIASQDPQVTHIRIYRMGGGITNFRLVAEIQNENCQFRDNVPNNELGPQCPTIGYVVPPNAKYIAASYGILFGALHNTLYFSDENSVVNWNPLNYINFDDEITGLASISLGLLVFTSTRTYLVSGNSKFNFYKQLLSDDIGCLDGGSIVTKGLDCVWQSANGLYSYGSMGLTNLTSQRIGHIADAIFSSCIVDNCYYGVTNSYILCINFKLQNAIYTLNLGNITSVANVGGKLLLCDGHSYYNLEGNALKMRWKSNWLQKFVTMIKNYKNLLVYSTGDLTYKAYIGDVEVASGQLVPGLTDIKVDQQHRLGYHMTLEFEGTGTVYEIQFLTEEWQNAT